MSGGGLTAAGLLVLLLAFIGLGVGIYYAYICLRARPVRPRQHTDCEDGPLIADPDVNGNHEEVPVEASAPVDESDSKIKASPDDHLCDDKSKAVPHESNRPVEEVPSKPEKEKEEVLIPIEVKPEPAELTHENETAEVLNRVAPAGFVAPIVHFQKDGTPVQNESPKKGESAKQKKAEPEVHHPINSPVPVFVPVSGVGKKPVTDSDEEDGLLLQKCAPHDDSLEPEACSDLSAPSKEELPVQNASFSAAKSEQGDANKHIASMSEKENPDPEPEPGDSSHKVVPEDSQPPKSFNTVAVAPDYGWRKEEPSPESTLMSSPNEVSKDMHQPLLMKEEVEHLLPAEEVSKLEAENGKPDSPVKIPNQSLEAPREDESQIAKVPEILVNAPSDVNVYHPDKETNGVVPELTEYPEVVYLETSKPFPTEKDSECSDSSDEEIPSQRKTIAPNTHGSLKACEENDSITDEKCEEQADCPPVVPGVSEVTLPCEEQKVSENVSLSPVTSDSEDSTKVMEDLPLKDNSNITLDLATHEPSAVDEKPSHQPVPVEPLMKSVVPEKREIGPSECLENAHESSPDVPLEAEGSYYGEPIDTLAVIKEEGSVDAESENTDTDTSEPEITHYTFSKESPASSTTNILADEISSTLEPEVTKFSLISELDEEENSELPVPKEGKALTTPLCSIANTSVDGNSENSASSKEDPPAKLRDAEQIPVVSDDLAKVPLVEKADTSISSESESEGDEAEPEIKELIVAPSVIQNQSLDTASPLSSTGTSVPDGNESSLPEVCKADLKTNSTEHAPQVTIVTMPQPTETSSNSSLSASSDSDLSDDEVTPSSPTKSKIPRLVERHGS